MTILMSVVFWLLKTGFCMKQTRTCRPFCTGSDCITLTQDRVDFRTAEEACWNRNGQLVTFHPETDEIILDILSQELLGNFWIGLSLPAGTCSNLSTPLRGYEWSSGIHGSFIPTSGTWKDSVQVCSPRCVSISDDQKWTERLCSDKTDGFLCRTKHKDACQAQELTGPNVFQSSESCKSGPCEHTCLDVKDGYICSCFEGYIPDSKEPWRCKLHCAQQKCPLVCDRDMGLCYCPDGFIKSELFCEDIDECSMDRCEQECENTFGSFVCSCTEGFVLKDEVKCTSTTPVVLGVVKTGGNNTLRGSSSSAVGFLWMWIFVLVAAVVILQLQ